MARPLTHQESTITHKIDNLDLTNCKAMLVRKIIAIRGNLKLIEKMQRQENRLDFLRNELSFLENKLQGLIKPAL